MPDTLPVSTNAQPDTASLTPSVTTPAQPGAYTGPNQKPGVVGGILKGVLSALSGPQTPQYTVDPNSGQVTQVPQHGETFRQMFGGILSGALEGLAGGFDKRPGERGGWAAAAARGFQARTQNLAQQDALARQKAVQQFQMQQQAKSQQLEQQKEADTVRMEATKAQLMHENIRAEEMNADKKRSESNYEANLGLFETLSKNGVPFTVSDIPGNDKSGNGGALMNIVSKYPKALNDANGDLRLPLRMEGPNGTTWKVIDIPATSKEHIVHVRFDPKLLKAAGVSLDGPLDQDMPVKDLMGVVAKGLSGLNQQGLMNSEIERNNAEADA